MQDSKARRRRVAFVVLAAVLACGMTLVTGASPAGAAEVTTTAYASPPQIDTPYDIVEGPDGNLWFTNTNADAIGRIDPATGLMDFFTEAGMYGPNELTVAEDGTIWFTAQSGHVGELDADTGEITLHPVGAAESPGAITQGPDGNMWLQYGSTGSGGIARFNPTTFAVATFQDANVQNVFDLTAGPDGNVWFTSYSTDRVGKITPAGVITTYQIDGSVQEDQPQGITLGSDGNLWFTFNDYDRGLGRVTPAGVVTTFVVGPAFSSDVPIGITSGSDGRIWFTTFGGDPAQIGSIDPADTADIVFEDLDPAVDFPRSLVEQDGYFWFVSTNGDQIGSYEVATDTTSLFEVADATIEAPTGIASDGEDALWFTSAGNNRIGTVDPDTGAIATFEDAGIVTPSAIAVAPDGDVWFTSFFSIGRYDPVAEEFDFYTDEDVQYPNAITVQANGQVWFTSPGVDGIGEIDPDDGAVTVHQDPSSNIASPSGIAEGSDGNIWFTSQNNHRIGRLVPSTGAISTFVDPADDVSNPGQMTAGPDGDLYFTNLLNGPVGRIDPATQAITVLTAGSTALQPRSITEGPDGDVWFTSSASSEEILGRVDPVTGAIELDEVTRDDVEGIRGIAVSGDDLWFTASESDRIVRGVVGDEPTPTLPGVPTSVGATAGDASATITWAAPTSDGDSDVFSYAVYRDGVQAHTTVSGNVFSWTDTGLTNGTEYEYQVAAVNVVGEGPKSAVVPVTPQLVPDPVFTDVGPSHPFFLDILWMYEEGISTGYQPGPTYRPSAPVSRMAMSAFLYRLAGEPEQPPATTPSFADVGTGHPFFDEIEWMADTEISTGYQGGTYRPNDPVTRQAMSAFLYRVAGEPTFTPPSSPTFTDVSLTHPFFAAIEWMAGEGISEGYQPGPAYRPSAAVSRQAMSAFMHRLADGPGVAI